MDPSSGQFLSFTRDVRRKDRVALRVALISVWWRFAGFVSQGNLCYYAPHPITSKLDGRDLVQFIPRLFVFITIFVLYSTLFSFLRRPDTIQLSSQFVSGGTHSETPKTVQMTRMIKRFGTKQEPKKPSVNPEAPWEQMECIQIGNGRPWGSPVQPAPSSFNPTSSTGILISKPVSPKLDPVYDTEPHVRYSDRSSLSTDGLTTPGPSQRPSETDTLVTDYRHDRDLEVTPVKKDLSPIFSTDSVFDSKSMDLDLGDVPVAAGQERRSSGQTLKEFFQENQAPDLNIDARGSGTGTNGKGVQLSATAYFNRQASILMLYFPLAVSDVTSGEFPC